VQTEQAPRPLPTSHRKVDKLNSTSETYHMPLFQPDMLTASHAISRSARSCKILGMRVDELDYPFILRQVHEWVTACLSRYICISTVHMIMESYDDERFQAIVNSADLITADGVPVVWVSRHLGLNEQSHVFGPELTVRLCEMAAQEGIPVGFYGSTPEILGQLRRNVTRRFPSLVVPLCYSPPFRPLTREEDDQVVTLINKSGIRILFVGLGCPKQECWMKDHRGRVSATMLGVGWAFEILAERSKMAPSWIKNIGMSWFYRLVLNPRKLWRRYLKHNPRFLILVSHQLWRQRRYPLDV
jgi:N-acetylglucosaminyldiphosphoundecaprenol N-acetyl-beta-D-mannosaminyltransferase